MRTGNFADEAVLPYPADLLLVFGTLVATSIELDPRGSGSGHVL